MKQFGIGLLTMTLGAVGTTGSRAQEVSYIIPTPRENASNFLPFNI